MRSKCVKIKEVDLSSGVVIFSKYGYKLDYHIIFEGISLYFDKPTMIGMAFIYYNLCMIDYSYFR